MKYKKINKSTKKIVANQYLNDWFAYLGYSSKTIAKLDVEEHDPSLLSDVEKASDMLFEAISDSSEIITISGDYDCDGICGTSVLYQGIKYLGKIPKYMIPDRIKDGYGMNRRLIDKAAEMGTTLLITVDNGISCHDAIEYAKSLGMKVIITDHHTIGNTLPNADVIVHPGLGKYPFRDISGATVAYKLMSYMIEKGNVENDDIDKKDIIDYLRCLSGITVISDVMPLVNENRVIFKRSIDYLKERKNPALTYLLELAEIDIEHIDETSYGFSICPMINAVGRISNAEYAVEFFITEDPKTRQYVGLSLSALNEKRKFMQKEALEKITVNDKHEGIVVFSTDKIHEGLIGIIAGRICQQYKKPTIVFTKAVLDGKEIWKGSARSTEDCNMFDVLSDMARTDPELFINFGGHAGAAGMSIPIDKKESFEDLYFQKVSAHTIEYEQAYMEVPADQVNDLVEAMKQWQPFGNGFPNPVIRMQFDVTNAKLYYKTGSAYLTNGIIDIWEKIPNVVDAIRNHDYRLTFSSFDKYLSNSEEEATKTEYYRPRHQLLSYDLICGISPNYFAGKDTIRAEILRFVEK